MSSINHKELREQLTKEWEEKGIYKTDTKSDKPKTYLLVEFPYPSGEGLHVGHVRSYTAMDIIARKKRREGYEVLFPMGFDAFGLPAENYAIKTGIHPSVTTRKNIDNFTRQMKDCGFSFDWSRVFETTDPAYYKWTQWIFLKMYEKGLAYKKEMPVNWCPKDKCVLANEEVLDGACERCGTAVEKKDKTQWMLAITKYAERLHKDLDETAYLDKIKIQQRNWIGLSEGSEIAFGIQGGSFTSSFVVFTTRADTIFGATYCVLAPEHPLVEELLQKNILTNADVVSSYREQARNKTDIDRSAEGKEKTGAKLEGVNAINPLTKEEIPVFIADYVLPQYGTGAIMAVPAHDERDGEFAKVLNIATKEVVAPETGKSQVNPEYRRSIVAVVWNKKNNTFLSINWGKDLGGNLFVGGGVEGEDDVLTTAVREIQEETGYKNIRYISTTGRMFHSYFAYSKNVARRIEATGLLFELLDEEKSSTNLEEVEKGKFAVEWLSQFDVEKLITEELHMLVYKRLVKGELYTGDGVLINSGVYDGMKSADARKKITEDVGGKIVIKSKLRDWVFARQRYWGEPTPIVYNKEGKMFPVHESHLPVVLPMVDTFEPTDTGESPLAQAKEWVEVRGYVDEDGYFHEDKDGEMYTRETDTMPQWAGSSWYFMRYIDPNNTQALGDKELLFKWLPVDWYNGGMEHTTLHLLYSRFWHKFLFDIGVVPTSEPYYKRTSQGMILGAGGVKMSKSLGNVVNPDKIIESHGPDVLRVYEMFVGPFDQSVAWDDKAILGVSRFLDKVEKLASYVSEEEEMLPITHQTIKKVSEGIDAMSFNTCISSLMICVNTYEEKKSLTKDEYHIFLKLLAPFAPFITEHLFRNSGGSGSIHETPWPIPSEEMMRESEVTYAFQVGGKLRGTFTAPLDEEEGGVLELLKTKDFYEKFVGNSEHKKVIFVKNRLINIVI